MKREFKCVGCEAANQSECLDLGRQPLANRFKTSPNKTTEYRHPLVVSACTACGLIQSLDPVPVEEMRPRESWIQYREPDFHFDEIAAAIAPLFTGAFSSAGLSLYDLSLLERIHAVHPRGGAPPSAPLDLGIKVFPFGMETVQKAFLTERLESSGADRQRYDLIVARYVLEHAHDPLEFLRRGRELLAPSGFLVLEIPLVRQPFEVLDYHVIWEEHTVYFMEQSLTALLAQAGFAIEKQLLFPSPFEQPGVIVVRKAEATGPMTASSGELKVMQAFAAGFEAKRTAIEEALRAKVAAGHRLLLFGAGHFAVAFVNFFRVEEYLEGVIDDDPNKIGSYLPGTALRIEPSSTLRERGGVTLIFCVNPDVEDKLKTKLGWFYESGGASRSIFALSRDYLLRVG